jgi:L-aminoadipate-semialdehyde dehydrogenase
MREFVKALGITERNAGVYAGEWIDHPDAQTLDSISPIDGELIASVTLATEEDYGRAVTSSHEAFLTWRNLPAPQRGEIVRLLGNALREVKDDLGALVTLEMGKILEEGRGEVQEMIDMADFSVGLSRQLYGLSMHSERPGHRMMEQWHPLGVIGIVSAFNFPVAVWSWNAFVAAVCGDAMIWKPSSKTPLTAIAIQNIVNGILEPRGLAGLMNLVVGRGSIVGEKMLADKRIPLISATGSCRMGYRVGSIVGERLGRCILELGGNNAIVVTEDADLDLATRAILFGAVGTAGQRCTSTRRIIMQKGIADDLTSRLLRSYEQIRIGDPLDRSTIMGPLVDQGAVAEMQAALGQVREQGGEILCGGGLLESDGFGGGCYVEPCIVKAPIGLPIVKDETFAPILYLTEVEDLEQAIEVHNDVPQGLSSSIFTSNLLSAETFLSPRGSDCGIANVNIGTSGAEIGGAFGGEKETGGGREAGSDSWKAYMRRQTCTINWSKELPLAQGIQFG